MTVGKSIDEISIGDKASFQKTISEANVYLFAGITGDYNPAHLNEVEAKKTVFGENCTWNFNCWTNLGSFRCSIARTRQNIFRSGFKIY